MCGVMWAVSAEPPKLCSPKQPHLPKFCPSNYPVYGIMGIIHEHVPNHTRHTVNSAGLINAIFSRVSCVCVTCRQALTEVSVLSDVLHIIHGHRQYIALDPVASTATPPSITYQYNIKKKVCM